MGRFSLIRRESFCKGCVAPFDEIISLREFGRSVADEDGPSFRVEWDALGDQISWDDGAMTMFQFRQLG